MEGLYVRFEETAIRIGTDGYRKASPGDCQLSSARDACFKKGLNFCFKIQSEYLTVVHETTYVIKRVEIKV